MKVDKIKFAKLKTHWEILKMKSAYIEAEKAIVQDPSLTAWQDNTYVSNSMSPDEFWTSFVKDTHKPVSLDDRSTERALLRAQIHEIEETGRQLLAEEKYELLAEAKEIWQKLNDQLNNLK